MAGHSTKHPYLKSYDELKRTMNRMQVYLDMHKSMIPKDEQQEIQDMIDHIEQAILRVPEEYQLTRFHQYKK